MKKKLEKELNKLLPEGRQVDKSKLHSITRINDSKFELGFETLRQPTEEELLEKAKRDYPEGTILKMGVAANEKIKYCTGEVIGYRCVDDGSIDSENGQGYYYYKGKWAEVAKRPILKLNNKFLYEGDEYWCICLQENSNLENVKVNKETILYPETDGDFFECFLTKKQALNYVLAEAKERFKNGYQYGKLNKYKNRGFEINNNSILDSDRGRGVWSSDKGWIAEPVKEPELMLGKYKVEINTVTLGKCMDDGVDVVIKCNGGQVTKQEWLSWYKTFQELVLNPSINYFELKLSKYMTSYHNNSIQQIHIGCIEHVSIDQIQAITDRLNEV